MLVPESCSSAEVLASLLPTQVAASTAAAKIPIKIPPSLGPDDVTRVSPLSWLWLKCPSIMLLRRAAEARGLLDALEVGQTALMLRV